MCVRARSASVACHGSLSACGTFSHPSISKDPATLLNNGPRVHANRPGQVEGTSLRGEAVVRVTLLSWMLVNGLKGLSSGKNLRAVPVQRRVLVLASTSMTMIDWSQEDEKTRPSIAFTLPA